MERIEGLVARGTAIDAAYLAAFAFADGRALKAEYDRWQASLRRGPVAASAHVITDEDRAAVLRLFAGVTRAAEVH